jgi:hypothetical protein
MAIQARSETLSTAAELICAGGSVQDPVTVVLSTASDDTIVLGGVGVTTAQGYPFLSTSSPLVLVLGPGDDLYAVASAGTPTIRVFETRQ